MNHTEVIRTSLDIILGRRKDIDEIVKVRQQIITIKKRYYDDMYIPKTSNIYNPKNDDVFSKMFTLSAESVIDEKNIYHKLGGDALLKKRIDTRNKLIELLQSHLIE